jgi:DNA-binding LytR/AlgR family response regulator
MLRIAICDDTQAELKQLLALTNEYITAHGIAADVREFSHPDALLTVCETKTFHIFLLDMVMPMVSGLELGRSIRRISTDAQIIFITTEPGFALDAYAVNPLHYLLKPVDKQAFYAALDLAMEKVHFGEEQTVTIKTREGLRTLSADAIACCEYVRHSVIYTLLSGERVETTTISGSFADHIAPLLQDHRFIQPHAAYAVNMSRVERLNKENFTLRGSIFVPVSGKQYTAVRNAYMSYRLGEV